jgi:dihydrofolate reductase
MNWQEEKRWRKFCGKKRLNHDKPPLTGKNGALPVARLIYSAIASLDGTIEDPDGRFDWAFPAEKIVFSNTLETVVTRKTRLERVFNPEAIRTLKTTDERDILVGGSNLAAHVFKAGLVDEIHLFLAPVVVGGGKSALPGGLRLDLRLLDERHFDNDMVFLHYQVR